MVTGYRGLRTFKTSSFDTLASAPFRPEWLIVPIAVLTVANVYAERALYADFSYVLVRLLDLRQFFWFDLIQRSGNALLTQIPIVVALKLGVTSLPLLKLLFNVSIYGAYLCLMLLIFAVAQRREDFYFPALSIFTASAFFQSFLSEAHTTVLLAWLLAVLIIPRRPLSAPLKALALAAAAVMMLTYETSVVFALFFAAISARRVRVARDEAWFWVLLTAVLVAGAGMQAWYIAHPLYPGNISTFGMAIGKVQSNTFLAVVPVFYALGLLLAWRNVSVSTGLATALVAIGGATCVAFRLLDVEAFSAMPKDEYPLRAFLSCAALGVLIIYFAAQQIPAWRDTLFRFAAATCCLLIGFQAIYQALLIRSWVRFTDAVGPVVAGGQRPVTSLIDTGLFQDHRLQRLTWTWTMPALGYLLAPGGRVETVVENCYNDMRPLRVYAPPDLNRYGITYAYLNKFGTDTKPPASQPVVNVDGDRWVARDIQVPREGLRVRLDRSLRVAWDRTLMTADPRDAYLVRYISGGNVVAVEERGPDTLSSRYTPNGASAVEIPPIDEIAIDPLCGEGGFKISTYSVLGAASGQASILFDTKGTPSDDVRFP